MPIPTVTFPIILFGLAQLLKHARRRHPAFRARLKERNLVAQIKARDEEIGRWFEIRDGKIASRRGLHAKPDMTLVLQERRARRRTADAADQLAQPDQRPEGLQAHASTGRKTSPTGSPRPS